jgi:hypothetical protein
MAGHDVLGIAQTGTGKTAAYLLPLLMKVRYAQGTNPRALVLAPRGNWPCRSRRACGNWPSTPTCGTPWPTAGWGQVAD